MTRLVPKSLAGQLIALLLGALVVSQVVSLALFIDERQVAVRAANRAQVLQRTASVVQLLHDTPAELHERILQSVSSYRLRYWISAESEVDPRDPDFADNALSRQLAELLERDGAGMPLVQVHDRGKRFKPWDDDWNDRRDGGRAEAEDDDDDDYKGKKDKHPPHRRLVSLTIAVPLDGGKWLNVSTVLPPPPAGWAWPTLLSMAVMAGCILVIVLVTVRRVGRPMRALANAADGLGRGEEVPPVREEGPEDVRRTTRAFNAMRDRLQRFVQGRTQMLAAISHDLRTPITSLRLHAEFVEDEETKRKILETLEEMERMVEATLAFAREEAAQEGTRTVDLAALLSSLCDDLAALGQEVTCAEAPRTPLACRPMALKRALRNLIENAVTYGLRARVALEGADEELRITIDDDGPGIPEGAEERVFEPFVRLEESRSRETGGVGLGLAIARSIVREHGGELTLTNRPEGGLRALVRLPRRGKT